MLDTNSIILKIIQRKDYPIHSKGVCNGVAYMLAQSFLANDLDSAWHRVQFLAITKDLDSQLALAQEYFRNKKYVSIEKIHTHALSDKTPFAKDLFEELKLFEPEYHPMVFNFLTLCERLLDKPEELKTLLQDEHAEETLRHGVTYYFSESLKLLKNSTRGKALFNFFRNIADENFNELIADIKELISQLKQHPDYLRNIIEIPAFLDGIALHQEPGAFTELFPLSISQRNPEFITPLTQSKSLEQEDALALEIPGVTNTYNHEQLEEYFSLLTALAKNSKAQFSLILSSGNHAINICFNPTTLNWIFIDANFLPPQYIEAENIASKVLSAFFCDNTVTMSSHFLTTNYDYEKVMQLKNSFIGHQIYGDMHILVENVTDDIGYTPAFLAARHGDINALKHLEKLGIDFNKCDTGKGQFNLLETATNFDQVETCKWLLDHGADPYNTYDPAICKAAELNNVVLCNLFLNSPYIKNNETIYQAFNIAAKEGHIDICKLFIKHGFDELEKVYLVLTQAAVNNRLDTFELLLTTFPQLNNPLILSGVLYQAANTSSLLEIHERLLDLGADPYLASNQNETALSIAGKNANHALCMKFLSRHPNPPAHVSGKAVLDTLKSGYSHTCEALIHAGFNCNYHESPPYQSALTLAAEKSKKYLCRQLIKGGADEVNIFHAFSIIVSNNDVKLCKVFLEQGIKPDLTLDDISIISLAARENQFDLMKLFLAPEFKPSAQVLGQALLAAVQEHHYEMCELLIKAGADLNYTQDNTTPLALAAEKGNIKICELLLAHGGVKINYSAQEKVTPPLVRAINNYHFELANFLLDCDADINYVDLNNETLLFAAIKENALTLIRYLLTHQIRLNITSNNSRTAFTSALESKNYQAALFIARRANNLSDLFPENVLQACPHWCDFNFIRTNLQKNPSFIDIFCNQTANTNFFHTLLAYQLMQITSKALKKYNVGPQPDFGFDLFKHHIQHGESGKARATQLILALRYGHLEALHEFFNNTLRDNDGKIMSGSSQAHDHSFISYILNELKAYPELQKIFDLNLDQAIDYTSSSATQTRQACLEKFKLVDLTSSQHFPATPQDKKYTYRA